MAPLLTGQVDVVTGWLTNTTALKALGPDRVDLTLWDGGVQLYALPYYATTKTLETQPKVIDAFLRATSRGWQQAKANRDEAVDLLVKEYPNLKREDERAAVDVMLDYCLRRPRADAGLGHHGPRRLAGTDLDVFGPGPVHRTHAEGGRRHRRSTRSRRPPLTRMKA